MAKRLEFYFDYGSPATYLAHTQMPGLAARTGAEIAYRPMLLGAVFKATGNASPVAVAAKGRYMWTDLERFARRYGVPFRLNPHFPVITLAVMRGAVAAQEDGVFEAYNAAVFRAMWVDGRAMAEAEVVARTLDEAGLDSARFAVRIAEAPVKDRLKASTGEAVTRGAFGAPTFFVGDEMFFGQDRLDFLEAALAG